MQSSNMAQMVKAIRMILEKFSFVAKSKKPVKGSPDFEIEDDAPKRKPSLEEIDALEVSYILLLLSGVYLHYFPIGLII